MQEQILFVIWYSFRLLFIGLMLIFVMSGLDDLFIDIVYFGRRLFRALFRRKQVKPVSVEDLRKMPEKRLAIIVPAWNESNVISRMLLNTLGTVDYSLYHIFVGTYPNDDATRLEVEKVRSIYPNVEAIVTPADGPTNKADCLNWIFQGIMNYETDHNMKFSAFIMHDSEDIIHPLSLRYYNYLIPRVHFIQIPVFPLPQEHTSLTYGTYMDEFSENHTKDMRVREFVSSTIPSAGVGTAISREALDYLAKNNKNQVFDITSLTEDYMMGIKLREFDGKKIFLQQHVAAASTGIAIDGKQKTLTEPLATREFFPTKFKDAVHQKARWILGISLQGWGLGWTKSPANNYFLFRDRKAIFTNLVVLLGYAVVGFVGITWSFNKVGLSNIPPLIGSGEIYAYLLYVVMGLFLWRIGNRVGATWSIFGARQGLLAIPRLFVGNVLNFAATIAAIRRFVASKISGVEPAWGKTEHAFPSSDQLRHYHRKLGDLLLEARLVSPEQLEDALTEQKDSGMSLGTILTSKGVLWEEDLVSTLARQKNQTSVEIDPYATSSELISLIPRHLAEEHRIFPLSKTDEAITFATDRTETDRNLLSATLNLEVGTDIRLVVCATPDLDFAIKRAYAPDAKHDLPVQERLGEYLLGKGLITEEQLKTALRRQKRESKQLGDVLVSMHAISAETLASELAGIQE